MFSQVWKKYLPVIIILMKRSGNDEQVLNMNHTDFERAAGGKKIKFTFSDLRLDNERIIYREKHSALAQDLSVLLREDDQSKILIRDQQFEFSMSPDFRLKIKKTTDRKADSSHTAGAAAEPGID